MRKRLKTFPFRRRKNGKTDYRKRLKLLLSNKPRVVVRKTLKNIIIQVIEYDEKGDKVSVSVSSKELEKKYGWKSNKGNIPSAYLTGLIAGKRAIENGFKDAVPDIGVARSTKGSRIYAALKGVIDAGLKVPCSQKVLPSKESLNGSNIAGYALSLKKENQEKYKKIFAYYLKNKRTPEDLPKYLEDIQRKIIGGNNEKKREEQ